MMTTLPRFFALLAMLSLTVGARAQEMVTILEERFDAVIPPEMPAGWTADEGWETSTSVASPVSGGPNLLHKGSSDGSATMPTVDLSSATAATLSYHARRTGSYSAKNLSVTASLDGGSSFPVVIIPAGEAVDSTSTSYELISVDLPASVLGIASVTFRFEGAGLNASSSNARIDDLVLTAMVPVHATPLELHFAVTPPESQDEIVTVTNLTAEPVEVGAPILNDDAFEISPSGVMALGPGEAQEFIVTFSPSTEGTYQDELSIPYEGGSTRVHLVGVANAGEFGFSEESGFALEESTLDISMRLSFAASDDLQGLQFRITWTDPVIEDAAVIPGDPVSDTSIWTLSQERNGTSIDVILLASGDNGLPPGAYDPLLNLRLQTGVLSSNEMQEVELGIEHVVGSLATPTGTDAGLPSVGSSYLLTVERLSAIPAISETHLDLGLVDVRSSSSVAVSITNDGAGLLIVDSIVVDNPLFSVSPIHLVVDPGLSDELTVAFEPTATDFGRQGALITLHHNGDPDPLVISATAKGLGGRGDTNADGLVDVLDVVLGIDIILGRLAPESGQLLSMDLFPFPDGNGVIDVRDLTVIAQAIGRGQWPDEVPLPIEEIEPEKGATAARLIATARSEDGFEIRLKHDVPIRGFQFILPTDDASVHLGSDLPLTLYHGFDAARREMRIVAFRSDGDVLQPGEITFLLNGVESLREPRFATVIDANRNRLPVESIFDPTVPDLPSEVIETLSMGGPYPNPVAPGSAGVNIPVQLPAGSYTVEIFDLLGRRIWATRGQSEGAAFELVWDGRDGRGRNASPGLYLIEVHTGAERAIRSVVVTR